MARKDMHNDPELCPAAEMIGVHIWDITAQNVEDLMVPDAIDITDEEYALTEKLVERKVSLLMECKNCGTPRVSSKTYDYRLGYSL